MLPAATRSVGLPPDCWERADFVVFGMMVLGSLASGGLLSAYGWNTVIWVSFLPLAVAVAALAFRASSRAGLSEA